MRIRTLRVISILGITACGKSPATDSHGAIPSGPPFDGPRIISDVPTGWTDSTRAWHLVPERTIAPSPNAVESLNNPFQILLTSDGGAIVFDRSPAAIRYFPVKGSSKLLGRIGEGPGEYRQPVGAMKGDTIVILDWTLRRVTLMTLNGDVLRSFAAPDHLETGPLIQVDTSGVLRVTVMRKSSKAFDSQWLRLSPQGTVLDTIVPPVITPKGEWTFQSDEWSAMATQIPLAAQTQYAFLPDGNVIYGRTDRDEFIVSKTGRDTVRIFGRRGATPISATVSERSDLLRDAVTGDTSMAKVARLEDIPSTHPLWSDLLVDGLGNMLVTREGDRKAHAVAHWDVYGPSGQWMGEMKAPFPPEWSQIVISADRMAILAGGGDEAPIVRIYRIVKP